MWLLAQLHNPFDPITDAVGGMKNAGESLIGGLIGFVFIVAVVVIVLIAGGLGGISGLVFRKAVSEELDDDAAAAKMPRSRWRGCLLALAGPFIGVGLLWAAISAWDDGPGAQGLTDAQGLQAFLLGTIGGIVFTVWYQCRRIRRRGKERAKGILFLFGLTITSVYVGALAAVIGASAVKPVLVHLHARVFGPSIQDRLRSSVEFDGSGHVVSISTEAELLPENWGKLVVSRAPTVRNISLDGAVIPDGLLADLARLPNLQELNLFRTQVSDSELLHITGFKHLRSLHLARTRITDAGMIHLKGLANLQTLILHHTQITDNGLAHIIGFKNLGDLHLARTQITDAGLVQLQALTNLGSLDLSGTQVTDAGLAHLKGMTGLRSLKLVKTSVTHAGVADLQKSLPNCKISK